MNRYNHIFDVAGNRDNQHLRGFLDVRSKEIVIYDDYNGKELFRIGNQVGHRQEEADQYDKAIISLEVRNSCDAKKTAILFASDREPLVQPLGITVVVKEIQSAIYDSHNYLRRDILSNPIKTLDFRYIVSNEAQLDNPLQFGYIPPHGNMRYVSFSPNNYISTYQSNNNLTNKFVYLPKFTGTIDSKTQILVPVNPHTTVTLQFTALFKKSYQKSYTNIYSPQTILKEKSDFGGDSDSEGGKKKIKNLVPKILITGGMLTLLAANVYLLIELRRMKKSA